MAPVGGDGLACDGGRGVIFGNNKLVGKLGFGQMYFEFSQLGTFEMTDGNVAVALLGLVESVVPQNRR